jgi:hypothetical protein
MDDRLSDLRSVMDARFETAKQELLRVEQVIDAGLSNLGARLSHIENR